MGFYKKLAAPRVEAAATSVEVAGLTGEHLDLPSEGLDAVLLTWTLCAIPDLPAALAQIRRVLKPDGSFHYAKGPRKPFGFMYEGRARKR